VPKFRKKPVVIEAEQWSPGVRVAGVKAAGESGRPLRYFDGEGRACPLTDEMGWCGTLEGGHVVSSGDWVITGVNGEKYPCKPDIFAKTYEKVED
jgi:hypothetical protein